MEVDENEKSMTVLRNVVLDHISQSNEAYFKSQQLGDPDLTQDEKRGIASDILSRSPALFLSRFGKYLLEEHLKFFRDSSLGGGEEYEISFYINEIQENKRKEKVQAVVKNRRLEALKRLVDEGEYFSEQEMKKRNPLLYEQLVGRFLSSDEKGERNFTFNYKTDTLSNFLLEGYDRDCTKHLLEIQQDEEDSVMEEEEDSSTEEEEEASKVQSNQFKCNIMSLWGERNIDLPIEISETEKKMLYEEFRSYMHANFLQGKDHNFDYSQVDSNAEYDNMEIVNQDEEEKYFDSESPTTELTTVSGFVDQNFETASTLTHPGVEGLQTEECSSGVNNDPLEAFMYNLEEETAQEELSSKMRYLNT